MEASLLCPLLHASPGTEGASFLDIPVGAGPAALGSAYTALAHDAYAPTWNPAGLGFLESSQIAGQHLSYLQGISYEYASLAVPLKAQRFSAQGSEPTAPSPGQAVGVSLQYLGSGDIAGVTDNGTPNGTFSSYYAAYNLSYGQALFSRRLSVGATGKLIQAKLADVSAHSYAGDLGLMYRANGRLTLGSTLTNLGSKLTFLQDGDSLPLAFHLGAAYQAASQWMLSLEGVYPKTGQASAHLGTEWQALPMLVLRAGYRTDTLNGLSPWAGFSTGLGLKVWGQELAYAWLPYGDLGETHYFSAILRWGGRPEARRNLIAYRHPQRAPSQPGAPPEPLDPDYQQLMELMTTPDQAVASKSEAGKTPESQP